VFVQRVVSQKVLFWSQETRAV